MAQNASAQTGLPTSWILAQASVESNWGRSGLASNYNNLFGMKGSGANSVVLPTTECNSGGCYKTTGSFATYPTQQASYDAYSSYIQRKGLSGYATDPNYQSTVGARASKIASALGTAIDVANKAGNILGTASTILGGDTTPIGIAVGAISGVLNGGDSCGSLDIICKLQKWLADSQFFKRLALFVIGGILFYAAWQVYGKD